MNQLTYNAGVAAGTALASIGAGLSWGLGPGLLVAGGLVIALTLAGVFLFGRAE